MSNNVDLQSVLSTHLAYYRSTHTLSARERQVCEHVMTCRTPVMGGVQMQCNSCDYGKAHYHACRDRHCPKCQRQLSRKWCDQQQANLLPVTYHHLVFTLPSELNGWVSQHSGLIYHLLFQCAWQTMRSFGADPKRLNGQMGMTAVLHTWGENLSRHVHLHCLVPGGAMDANGKWCEAKSNYLFPVRALSRYFRGRMVSQLRLARAQGKLNGIGTDTDVQKTLNALMSKQWVVYSKPCVGRSEEVVNYLARYSHRIAISDQRLLSNDEHSVRFRYKDYRNECSRKTMVLANDEFIRRYLLHVLPKGLMRIRHYGFLANRCRAKNLIRLRRAIAKSKSSPDGTQKKPEKQKLTLTDDYPCPKCRLGLLCPIAVLKQRRLTEG